MTTPNIGMENVPSNSLQPGVAVNDAFQLIDALLPGVVQAIAATPPTTLTADAGKVWIVDVDATGAWDGHDGELAIATGADLWRFVAPQAGWRFDVGGDVYRFDGDAWAEVVGGGGGGTPDDGSVGTAKIADGAVTYAKMQDVTASQRVIGRNASGAGDPEEVTISQVLDWLSNTRGSVLYRGASGWSALAPGTAGHFLQTGGSGADPAWAAASGGGGMANPMTTAGDLIIGGTSGAPARLAKDTDGKVLTLVSGAPAWATPAAGGGALTYFTESVNTSAPNSAAAPIHELTPNSAQANVSVSLRVKGTGYITAQTPDGLASGGSTRGNNAVDLQFSRTGSAMVASGANSALIGGVNNQAGASRSAVIGGSENSASSADTAVLGGASNSASGQYSTVSGGRSNTAGGTHAFIGGGSSNSTSGANNFVAGGYSNTATGQSAHASGELANTRGIGGARAHGSSAGAAGVSGSTQMMGLTVSGLTTNATPAALVSLASVSASTAQLALPDNSAYYVKGIAVARKSSGGDAKSWEFSALIKRGTGAASVAFVGTPTMNVIAADAGAAAWTLAITADTSYGALVLTATGEAATTIRWAADMQSVQVVA